MTKIDRWADVIDLRDVIARVEELEGQTEPESLTEGDAEELKVLNELLGDLKDQGGGDEQWRGDWYPVTLVRDSYFQDYAQELAEDIGAIPADVSWPCTCIDWERAARELRMDYSSVDFDGVIYLWR